MGVQTILRSDPDYYRRLLRFWNSMLIDQIKASQKMRALRDAEVWGDWRRRGWLTVPSGR